MEPNKSQDDEPPIEALLGGGVSGAVYALDEDTVLKSATGSSSSVQDLEVERRIYERLGRHPRILRRICVEARGLVLERLVCPLRKRLRDLHQKGEVPSDETVMNWAGQVIDGLGYIHSKDVLQADIGCHNLLLDKNDDLKLCDFGGSSINGEKPTVCYESRSRHPAVQGPNIASEVFALGSTLYEMSTTEPPFPKINSATGEIPKALCSRRISQGKAFDTRKEYREMLERLLPKYSRRSFRLTASRVKSSFRTLHHLLYPGHL